MKPLKLERPTFLVGESGEFVIRRPTKEAHAEAARWHISAALEAHGTELDDYARELLEAVKHIDNARKMLREEGGE